MLDLGATGLNTAIKTVCTAAIPMMLAVTVHESAHGYVAKINGDDTARRAGRLTLNPIAHISLMGSIVLPLLLLFVGALFLFSLDNYVPLNPNYFKDYKKGLRQMAFAGPGSNLLMMFIWAFLMVLFSILSIRFGRYLFFSFMIEMAQFGIGINAVLAVFNLLPIPPLDGSRIVNSFLSDELSHRYLQLEPYGFIIVLVLMYCGFFSLLSPIIAGLTGFAVTLSNFIFQLFM